MTSPVFRDALHRLSVQGGDVDPSPEQAREWLRQELAKPPYAKSLWERLRDWFLSLFEIQSTGSLPISTWLFVILGAVVIVGLVVVLLRHRRRRTPEEAVIVQTDAHLTPADFARRADDAWNAGGFTDAAIDYFRATAAHLTVLHWLPPGEAITTADVVGALQRHGHPDLQQAGSAAALIFDQARYGHTTLTAAQAQTVRDLATEVLAVTPPAVTPPAVTPLAPVSTPAPDAAGGQS